ncbi:unnamed protein product [Danaus chrysippus]|uniref:(African queen) hypothetical protein n=1 Tax=Danaus chrysippus TaxID=151541 RepID=A0A8J2R3E2_9NEOP|nr:unnamed protein product [Danaus chrysippus]
MEEWIFFCYSFWSERCLRTPSGSRRRADCWDRTRLYPGEGWVSVGDVPAIMNLIPAAYGVYSIAGRLTIDRIRATVEERKTRAN